MIVIYKRSRAAAKAHKAVCNERHFFHLSHWKGESALSAKQRRRVRYWHRVAERWVPGFLVEFCPGPPKGKRKKKLEAYRARRYPSEFSGSH